MNHRLSHLGKDRLASAALWTNDAADTAAAAQLP